MAMSRNDYIRLTGMAPATNAAVPQSGPVLHSGIGAGLDGIVTTNGQLNIGAGGASATAKIGGSAFMLIAAAIAAFYILTKERQF